MRQNKPAPITEDELYGEPPAAEVVQFPNELPPAASEQLGPIHPRPTADSYRPDPKPEPPISQPKPKDGRMAAVSIAIDILSFRLILLLCAMASAGLFVMAALWPDPWRLAAAAAFSVIVTAPCLFFYKGL